MITDLPEGWTLSEPNLFIHGQWFLAHFYGRRMPLILLNLNGGDWMIQNKKEKYESAGGAMRAAIEATGITMD